MADFNITCYENLIIGIIKQAACDYKRAVNKLKKDPDCQIASSQKKQCEKFFLHQVSMYEPIVSIDGSYLLRELEKEVEKTKKKAA